MTIATWRAEFYPIEAEETLREDALSHSIRKWEGLRPENLAKHDLQIVAGGYGTIAEEGYDHSRSMYSDSNPIHSFRMHSGNCALCHHYDHEPYKCKDCPLYKARGSRRCDSARIDERDSPWHSFSIHNDPMPMIAWLEKSKKFDPSEKERQEKEAQEAFERDVAANIANYGYYQVILNGGRRSWTKVDLTLLADLLPHGSGLNGSWYITVAKNGKATCRTSFSPMNAQGYYLSDVEVGAEFFMGRHPHSDSLSLGRVWARRDSFLRDYLYDLMLDTREKYNGKKAPVPQGWDKV